MSADSNVGLPLPCKHTHKAWRYRVSSHADDETREDRAFCSVWVCARSECIDRGKRYVAASALCAPLVIDGDSRKVVTL